MRKRASGIIAVQIHIVNVGQ